MKKNYISKLLSLILCITLIPAMPFALADDGTGHLGNDNGLGGLTFGGGAFSSQVTGGNFGSSLRTKPQGRDEVKNDRAENDRTQAHLALAPSDAWARQVMKASPITPMRIALMNRFERNTKNSNAKKEESAPPTNPHDNREENNNDASDALKAKKDPTNTGSTNPATMPNFKPDTGEATSTTTTSSSTSSSTSNDDDAAMDEQMKRMEKAQPFMEMAQKWDDYLSLIEMELGLALTMQDKLKSAHKEFRKILSPLNDLIGQIGHTSGNPLAPAGANLTRDEFDSYKDDRSDILDGYATARSDAADALSSAIDALKAQRDLAKAAIKDAEKAIKAIMNGESTTTGVSSPPEEIPADITADLRIASLGIGIMNSKHERLRKLAGRLVMRVNITRWLYFYAGISLNAAQQRVLDYADELSKVI